MFFYDVDDLMNALGIKHDPQEWRLFIDSSKLSLKNVDGLMNALGIKHDPQEWRLFTDSSKLSLKAVLLHNGNHHPSIPFRYAGHMKETYENLKQLLNKLGYSKYG